MRPLRYHVPPPRRTQQGAGLLEVLIAVFVMAIGLLGIAAMQAAALRNSQSAAERGQAVVQTHTILDSMRANRAAARAGLYNLTLTGTPPADATLIARDQARWITGIQSAMGSAAKGAINCTATLCTITIQWDDSRGSAGSNEEQLVTETRL